MYGNIIKSYARATVTVWALIFIISLFKIPIIFSSILFLLLYSLHFPIWRWSLGSEIQENHDMNSKVIHISVVRNAFILIGAFLIMDNPQSLITIMAITECLQFLNLGYFFNMPRLYFFSILSSLILLFLGIYLKDFVIQLLLIFLLLIYIFGYKD